MEQLRRCPRCETELASSAFNYRNREQTKLQSYCRDCSNAAWREWYSEAINKESHRALMAKRRKRRNDRHRAIVDRAKSVPCADCGVSYPPYVMDFDHIDADKDDVISRLKFSAGTKRLLEEIDKCEVVCSNCHRIRTFTRTGD
jgi:hypothetical protein